MARIRGTPPVRTRGKMTRAQRLEMELAQASHRRQAERMIARGRASDAERLAAELRKRKR